MTLNDHCPTCRLNWQAFPPVKCDGSNHYRCVECKAVYSGEMLYAADVLAAALPFAGHDWMDAELEDDSCKLTRHSGPITVGHWRALRAAIRQAEGLAPVNSQHTNRTDGS